MRNCLTVVLITPFWFLSLLIQAAEQPQNRQNESERLRIWLDERYEEELAFRPMLQTRFGRKQQYDRIDDFSEAAEDAQLKWQLDSVDDLRSHFDYSKLNSDARISYDYWIYRADLARENQRWRRNNYIFTQVSAIHAGLVQFMINYHRVDNVQDMHDYISRLKALARALNQLQVRAEKAAVAGVRPPRFVYDIVIDQSRGVISGQPFDNTDVNAPLWGDVLAKTRTLKEIGNIDTTAMNKLRAQARKILVDDIQAAYQQLITWLESDRANTDVQAHGVAALPDGIAYYEQQLKNYTTTELSADEIHALGLSEVARIQGEMDAIREQVGFDGSLRAFFDFVRSDKQFYFPDTDAGRQAYIDESVHYLKEIEMKLPDYFGLLPNIPLEVRRVEALRERDGASAFYEKGTADGLRSGVYYVHLSDMSANNKTDLQTTAYHEGSPGHHMQFSVALGREDLPLFRTHVWYSAYGEGWALYSEQLAWEMGLYSNPYYNFGRLGAEMFRAIRLVVDTGIHAKAWTEEEAVHYMLANSAIPETAVRSEIQRYLVWPGQATSYKIGMLKILELRERAQVAMGESFDIRTYHDLILGGGSLPLSILERHVNEWINPYSNGVKQH